MIKQPNLPGIPRRRSYPPEWEELWAMYPKRGDQNPKRLAYEQYAKRLKEGVPHDEMKEGLERYILYCEMKGITGTPFVMMAQTFFGPHERWADEFNYTPPEGEGGVFWGGS